MSSRSLSALAVPFALALLGGCSETTVPAQGVYHPTLIAVAPAEFLGPIPCIDAEGGMRAYVATVFNTEYLPDGSPVTADDVASGDAVSGPTPGVGCNADAEPGTSPRATVGFALPSAGPVACENPVTVSRVVENHRYRAEIEGYDRADLVALAPGVPILVDPSTGERVTPRWRFSCGDDCPEHAHVALTRAIDNCKLLPGSEGAPSGPAAVTIAPDALTGATCGSDPGEVERVEVSYDAFGQSATVSGACGDSIELDDVPVRGTLTISVLAYEAGNPEPRWGSTCTALPTSGLTVPATCAPLHDEGALVVDPAQALGALGYDCSSLTDLPGELELALGNDQRFVEASNCSQAVRFSGLQVGPAAVLATLRSGTTELGQASCGATVVPAGSVTAICSLEP
jgi:hypothetical protein